MSQNRQMSPKVSDLKDKHSDISVHNRFQPLSDTVNTGQTGSNPNIQCKKPTKGKAQKISKSTISSQEAVKQENLTKNIVKNGPSDVSVCKYALGLQTIAKRGNSQGKNGRFQQKSI